MAWLTHRQASKLLRRMNACPNAIHWFELYPTPMAAWLACDRSDWMGFVLRRLGLQQPLGLHVNAIRERVAFEHVELAAIRKFNNRTTSLGMYWLDKPQGPAPLDPPLDHLTRLGFLPRTNTESLQRSSL
jgi:hypothetical protein